MSANAFDYLRQARLFLDVHTDLMESGLRATGFGKGGLWMSEALGVMRSRPSAPKEPKLAPLGYRKYGVCGLAGLLVGALAIPLGVPSVLMLGLAGFYVAEAHQAFTFPASIDYGRRGPKAARVLFHRAGGSISILTIIIPIAALMLLGWVINGRFRRNWFLGCTAILAWYEDVRLRRDHYAPLLDLVARAPLKVRRIADAKSPEPIKVMFASDLHVGAWGSGRPLRELLRLVHKHQPEILLLGGDLVDHSRAMPQLRTWLRRISRVCIVAAVPGNHDLWILDAVRTAVLQTGCIWLPDRSLTLDGLRVDGRPLPADPSSGVKRVLCAHHPDVFDEAAALGYAMVMAGHLHGGQLVFAEVHGRQFPGAFLSRWNGLDFAIGKSRMFVSRGLADTLPIRFNCPREVLLAEFDRAVPMEGTIRSLQERRPTLHRQASTVAARTRRLHADPRLPVP